MAETSFPFASSEIATEDQWSAMFRMAQADGVFATDPTGSDLRVTGSGTSTVAVAAGEAWVQGTYYSNSAVLNVSVPTNSGGASARKDLVVLRRDPSGDVVSVKYKTGSTGFPALTQTLNGTWEIPLAEVTVAAGASVVASAAAVDQRWFTGRQAVLGNAAARRPPAKGQLLVEGKTVLLGNGASWDTLAIAGQDTGWKPIDLGFTYTTRSAPCDYRAKDGMVSLRGSFQRLTGNLPTNTVHFGTVPVEARPGLSRFAVVPMELNTVDVGGTATDFIAARIEIHPDGTLWHTIPDPVSAAWCGLDGVTYSL